MPLTQGRLLNSLRFNRIVGRLAAELEIARPLNFLARLPLVPAFDDELTGRFTGKIIVADLIADDQEAVVQESMSLDIVTHSAPNVKIGQRLGQKTLNRLASWEAGLYQSVEGGEDALRDWEMQLAENLLLAVRERMNAMACSMMLDDFDYDRFGIKIANASWGMPSALKTTVSIAWGTNPTTADPLNDIWAVDQYARLTYGIEYDTVTMSTQDFRDMMNTTAFANKAALTVNAGYLTGTSSFPTKNDPAMMKIAASVLGKDIILDDTTIRERNNAGTDTLTRVLPTHKVLLSRSQDNGNARVQDFGNGVVTESMVADMVGGAMLGGNLGGNQYGPIAYWTGRESLNPPDVTAFAVARCFPRCYLPECHAVLQVG